MSENEKSVLPVELYLGDVISQKTKLRTTKYFKVVGLFATEIATHPTIVVRPCDKNGIVKPKSRKKEITIPVTGSVERIKRAKVANRFDADVLVSLMNQTVPEDYVSVSKLSVGDVFKIAADPNSVRAEEKYYRVLNLTGSEDRAKHQDTINAVECNEEGRLIVPIPNSHKFNLASYDPAMIGLYRSDGVKIRGERNLIHRDISLKIGVSVKRIIKLG